MDKTIISVAVVGSGPTKDMNPAVPYTPKEIAEAAIECHKAGCGNYAYPCARSRDGYCVFADRAFQRGGGSDSASL